MIDRGEKARDEFLSESQEIVEQFNRDLLAIAGADRDRERSAGLGRPDPELINDAFRAVHSLKGLAGLFGVQRMLHMSHQLENLLDALRMGRVPISPAILDLLFEAIEIYQRIIGETGQGAPLDTKSPAIDDFVARLDRAQQRAPEAGPQVPEHPWGGFELDPMLLAVLTEYEEHRLRENIREGRALYRILASFPLQSIDLELENLKARLKPVGEVITYLPGTGGGDPDRIDLEVMLGSSLNLATVAQSVGETSAEVLPVPRREPAAPAAPRGSILPHGAGFGAAPAPRQGQGIDPGAGQVLPLGLGPGIGPGPGPGIEQTALPGDLHGPGQGQPRQQQDPDRPHLQGAGQQGLGPAPGQGQGQSMPSARERQAFFSSQDPGRPIPGGATPGASSGPSPAAGSFSGPGPGLGPGRGLDRGEAGEPLSPDTPSLKSVAQTVRVDIRKLDHLMNIVGELALARAGVQSIQNELKRDRGHAELARALQDELRVLSRKLDELQAGILEVRMVPLGQVFDKLSRVVRKLSREAGKEIRFVVSGADTELDKLIVEELSDPLMHVIRNAIDHGIERAPERARAGKPEAGTVAISAEQRGNHVVLEVEDDGAGIDTQGLINRAVARGLLTEEQARELPQQEVYNLMFLPGLSTRDVADEISGRGVGMDVVKTNIARLSGIIDLASEPGQGTRLTITLPITLAIIQALVIRAAGRTYAIPLNSVMESLMLDYAQICTIERREVITLRDQTLPLLRLDEAFHLRRPAGQATPQRGYVVVVALAQHRLGLLVDDLVGQQDIVIKSLGRALQGIPGIAGATELGGQQTALVLDVRALAEEALPRAVEAA